MPKSRPRRPDADEPRDDAASATVTEPVGDRDGAESPPAQVTEPTPEPKGESTPEPKGEKGEEYGAARRRTFRDWPPFLLVRAAHPRQAVLTALGLTVAAALDDRPGRELALVFATVLVGQAILGWHNDLVDEQVDREHQRRGKPIAEGRLEAGTAWFALCCAVLLVVPLAVSNGTRAGVAYLASVVVGMLGNVVLRRGPLSFVPWAVAFALYPFFLSYGGWGGGAQGDPPEWVMVGLSAALGVGVHVLLSLWGFVADNDDGWTYLPLRLGLRLGATRLLVVTLVYCAAVVAVVVFEAQQVGLSR